MKKYIYFALMIIWMGVIFSFSSANADISGEQSMSMIEYILDFSGIECSEDTINILETILRKIAHFSEYFVLGVISFLFVDSSGKRKVKLLSFLICLFYAVSDEVHQHFVPGRACRIFDMFVDGLGGITGIYIIDFVTRKIFVRK